MQKVVDPAELARIISLSPVEPLINAFAALPEKSQPKTFAYLGKGIQKHIIFVTCPWF